MEIDHKNRTIGHEGEVFGFSELLGEELEEYADSDAEEERELDIFRDLS